MIEKHEGFDMHVRRRFMSVYTTSCLQVDKFNHVSTYNTLIQIKNYDIQDLTNVGLQLFMNQLP